MKFVKIEKKIITNFSWMIGQQVYNMLLCVIIGSLSARYLGPPNYGVINYSASIISFLTVISKLGIDGVIINEMIRTPSKRGIYLGTALTLRIFASIASVFCVLTIVKVLETGNNVLYMVTLLQSIAIVLQAYEVFIFWFQIEFKMKYVSIATMVAQTVVGLWRISLLVKKASIYWFALSSSIHYLVCGIAVVIFFIRQKNDDIKVFFSWIDGKDLIKKSYHFIITDVAITFYMKIDKIMIGKMISPEAVGMYAAATTISTFWGLIPIALINSITPLIIRKREKNYDEYIKGFQQLLLIITFLSIGIFILTMLFGKLAIIVLYGEKYLEAVKPLSILICSTGFAMIGTVRGVWIVAESYNKYSKYYILMGAVVNFVLNRVAILKFGITGAAVATLISQFVVAFVAPALFHRTRAFNKIFLDSFKQVPELILRIKTPLRP